MKNTEKKILIYRLQKQNAYTTSPRERIDPVIASTKFSLSLTLTFKECENQIDGRNRSPAIIIRGLFCRLTIEMGC
jgi:hypothetical protein